MTHFGGPRILEGGRLAGRRATELAGRAAGVTAAKGRAPALALIAPGLPDSPSPHVGIKQRAARAVGVDTRIRSIPPDAPTGSVREAVLEVAADPGVDGIFVQYPLPEGVDEQAVFDAIPPERDVDVLSAAEFRRFVQDSGPAPATAAAGFLILDEHSVDLRGRTVRVVGEPSTLQEAFEVMAGRRGAHVLDRVSPGDPALAAALARTQVAVALIGRPGALDARLLPAAAIAIDGGYFNPGGRGDVDATRANHLGGLVPVPGGLGPMTVSVLLERTIERAARGA